MVNDELGRVILEFVCRAWKSDGKF